MEDLYDRIVLYFYYQESIVQNVFSRILGENDDIAIKYFKTLEWKKKICNNLFLIRFQP